MLFDHLLHRTRSSSKQQQSKSVAPPTTAPISRITSSTSSTTHPDTIPEIMKNGTDQHDHTMEAEEETNAMTRTATEARDYELFLAKAKRDAEKAERKRVKEIQKARRLDMSPWSGRM